MASGGEFITAMEEAATAAETLVSTYEGSASDGGEEDTPCKVPSAMLDELLTGEVMFSVTKSIAVQEGIDFIVAQGRANALYKGDRASYYTEAVSEGSTEITEAEKLRAIMQRFLEYGSTTL